MGKRSSGFAQQSRDYYPTPYVGALPLLPYLRGIRNFAEPCVGGGHLVRHLAIHGLVCSYQGDLETGQDALTYPFWDFARFDAIITNPPWSRDVLHPMIELFQDLAPTWLLLEADWAHTVQAAPFLDQCSHIVSIGRLKWIERSAHTGKDNAAWYRFHAQHSGGPRFFPREVRS